MESFDEYEKLCAKTIRLKDVDQKYISILLASPWKKKKDAPFGGDIFGSLSSTTKKKEEKKPNIDPGFLAKFSKATQEKLIAQAASAPNEDEANSLAIRKAQTQALPETDLPLGKKAPSSYMDMIRAR